VILISRPTINELESKRREFPAFFVGARVRASETNPITSGA
jgi:hypothetical protein